MNMISTGAFLNEMDASSKQTSTAEKFAAVWEKKNAKAARAGGVSLMALSLAACGGSSSTTTTSTTTTDTTTTTVTPSSEALTVGLDAVTGTSAGDSFSGARIDSIQTWNGGDSVDGGAGTDTLTAVITADVAPSDGNVTNVENIVITNANAATATDLVVTFSTATTTGISGVTNVTNLGSTDAISFTRIADLAEITLNNTAKATTVTYADSVLAGSADTVVLNVNGNTGAVNIGDSTGGGDAIESLTINAMGGSSTFSAANLDATATSVTVTGAGNLDLSGASAFASVGTFDASAATGNVKVDFLDDGVTGATNTKTITTGSGADLVEIDNIAIAKVGDVSVSTGAGNDTVTLGDKGAVDYTIDGGDGIDVISIGANSSAATHGGISNFEKLYVTAGATQNMLLYTGNNAWTTLRADAATVNFTNVPATVTTLELTANAGTAATFARVVDGTADTLTIKPTAANTATTVTVDDEETITIDSNTNSATFTNFNAEDLVTLTVTGDNNIDIGTYDADTELLTTIDATGMSNANFSGIFSDADLALTVTSHTATSDNTGTLTITTGAGADNVTGTANNDTITTGGGNDTIVAGAGADTVTGGTGSDTITLGAGIDIVKFQTTNNGIDNVTDFTITGSTSDDRIAVNIITDDTTNATTIASTVDADAVAIEEIGATTTETVSDNDVAVLTGDLFLDVSGNAAADLAAIQGAGGGTTMAKSDEALFIFKADTDGDGTADEVQLWYLATDSTSDTDIDTVTQLATLGIDINQDLASDFVVGDFDL